MATTTELIRKMVIAFKRGDPSAFESAVNELIVEERRKNHATVARDLERLLANGTVSRQGEWLSRTAFSSDLPRDKERNALLIELREESRGLEDLILAPSLRATLDRILNENRRGDLLRAHGLRPVGKVLFFGPPGCGKTAAAAALAKELYLPLALVRFDAVVSSYLGETAANLRKVFEFARSRPMVLLFDEFDAIGKSRTDDAEHGELRRVVNSFLQMLDGFRGDTLIIAATNHEQLLDPALWRRFDEVCRFDLPDAKEIEALLLLLLRQVGISPTVRLANEARSLVGSSFADVERIARDAIKDTVLSEAAAVDADALHRASEHQRRRLEVVISERATVSARNGHNTRRQRRRE